MCAQGNRSRDSWRKGNLILSVLGSPLSQVRSGNPLRLMMQAQASCSIRRKLDSPFWKHAMHGVDQRGTQWLSYLQARHSVEPGFQTFQEFLLSHYAHCSAGGYEKTGKICLEPSGSNRSTGSLALRPSTEQYTAHAWCYVLGKPGMSVECYPCNIISLHDLRNGRIIMDKLLSRCAPKGPSSIFSKHARIVQNLLPSTDVQNAELDSIYLF